MKSSVYLRSFYITLGEILVHALAHTLSISVYVNTSTKKKLLNEVFSVGEAKHQSSRKNGGTKK